MQQRLAGLQGANDKLKEEADAIKRKLDMLNEAVAATQAEHQHGRANCPLCNGLLDADALARVCASYRTGYYRAPRAVEDKQARV